MELLFSTDDVHPRDRLTYWREIACRTFVELDFVTEAGPKFSANIRSASIGTIDLSLIETDAGKVLRTSEDIRRSSADEVLVSLQLRGKTIIQQGDRHVALTPGKMALYDTQKSYSIDVGRDSHQMVLKLPRSVVTRRMGAIAPYTARDICKANPVGGLAKNFIRMLPEYTNSIDDIAKQKIADQALDLLALACARMRRQTEVRSTHSSASLALLKSVIDANFTDPTFGPAMAAAASGMSVRNANYLLSSEDTSLEKYIISRRLDLSKTALQDGFQLHRSIQQIAFASGFSSSSHFSRKFKERFGITPTQCRDMMRWGVAETSCP